MPASFLSEEVRYWQLVREGGIGLDSSNSGPEVVEENENECPQS
jgi:hypothetical protein